MIFLTDSERRPALLVILAAFLAPLMGGSIQMDNQGLAPGELPGALLSNPAAATLSQTLLLLLMIGAGIWSVASRKVVTVPKNPVMGPFLAFAVAMFLGLLVSEYRFASLGATAYGIGLALSLLAVIMVVGRGQGVMLVLAALSLGTGLLAANGIMGYATQPDPNWRIFSLWLNPNALSGMLLFGYFAAVAVTLSAPRAMAMIAGLMALLNACALVLTGSKGGLLAAAVGSVLCLLFLAIRTKKATSLLVVAFLALGFGLSQVLTARVASGPKGTGGTAGPSRVIDAGGTAEQSVGFRALLWKGAVDLAKQRPMGWGTGTYRIQSSRGGITTQTQTAHNSFLQLAVEGGIVAALGLLLGGLAVLFEGLKGSSKQPASLAVLKGPLMGGIVAAAIHNMIDSDLYFAGTGLALMMFLGLLMLTSADGLVPEFSPKVVRPAYLVSGVAIILAMAFVARVDLSQAKFIAVAGTGDVPTIQGAIEGIRGNASIDPRANYTLFQSSRSTGGNLEEQMAHLERAIELGATPSYYRQLARLKIEARDREGAISNLKKALLLDPNNLPALSLWLEVEKEEPTLAIPVAQKLVAVEQTEYFKIRSLPEFVPTETYEARVYLAKHESNPATREEHYKAALKGFADFARRTVPEVVKFDEGGLGGFLGVTRADATATVEEGLAIKDQLRDADPADVAALEAAAARLSK